MNMLLKAGRDFSGAAAYLLRDLFTDTNGVRLNAHTMDVGAGWTEHIGIWDILSNKATLDTISVDEHVVTANAGVANVTTQVDWTVGNPNYDAGLAFNFQDTSNYWYFIARLGNWLLFQKVAGTPTQRGSVASGAIAGTSQALKVITNGDTVDCYANDVLKITYTVGSRPLKTATRFGLRIFRSELTEDSASSFDNFQVT